MFAVESVTFVVNVGRIYEEVNAEYLILIRIIDYKLLRSLLLTHNNNNRHKRLYGNALEYSNSSGSYSQLQALMV